MSDNNLVEAQETLRWFRSFDQCLLHDVRWRRFGSEVDLVFNYIWGDDGECRELVLEQPRLVTVRCSGVFEIVLSNGLNQSMIEQPDQLTWGLTEVAIVRLESRRLYDRDAVRVAVAWEWGRSLTIIASGVQIAELR